MNDTLFGNISQWSSGVGYNGTESALKHYHVILLPVISSIIIIVGSIGNGLVIYTLGKNGEMTPTNCYVINLAIADLTFIVIVVPFTTVAIILPEWIFGDGMCKIVHYMMYVSIHATCLTLTAMTVDRFHAIVYPVSSMKWRSNKASTIISVSVWAVSLLLSVPFAMFSKESIDEKHKWIYCKENWPTVSIQEGMQMAVICTTYEECNGTTPLSSQSQIRRRKKVTRMVAVVVALFAIFWFPIHFINVYLKFFKNFDTSSQMLYNSKIFAHTLSYANSCVNPFVYAFLNDGFKKAFNKTFPSCWWCPCARPKNYERCTQVTGMVDQAVQAIPDEEHDNENDCELIQLNQVRKHSSQRPSFV
ncbi:hypothetical protein KUTeg_008594 [Tegillarca granosa]|uniref:G-protein coupled receptors family 1 profile domain-containing protein n=1 Tax=Tegillarca granosa TaxID=220873 RepID=A0ABQ9F9K4_TEGGR|nr:hypothetical protein KUTeg_008594 [Tegillarca granosa]